MPDTTDTETLEKLKDLYPYVKVIILSSFYEDDIIMRFIKKGSNSFLSKNCDPDSLIRTIETVYEKGLYYDEKILSLMPKIFETNTSIDKHKDTELTKRELEILQMMCKGWKSREIADTLNVDIRTVETHRSHIWKKTNCDNVLRLKEIALKNGFITSE